MSMVISGDNGLTFPAGSTQVQAGNFQTMVNRIINPRMEIDQRNAGASVTITTAEEYIVDRFNFAPSVSSKLTGQQSSVAPAGFSNSILLTSTAATSVATGDYYFMQHKIEGFNFADCNWGTADAKTVTLSFWCRSSITGTYGGALVNSAQNRSYPFTYSISVADTWEYKTVTIVGDTTGTWVGATNGIGVRLRLGFGVGSTYSGTAGAWAGSNFMSATGATNWISTNGATFYITGVDLRVGSYTVVPQDFRAYGTELQLCERYYSKQSTTGSGGGQGDFASGIQTSTTAGVAYIKFNTKMRASPTITFSNIRATDHNSYEVAATLGSSGQGYDATYLAYNFSANGAQYRPQLLASPLNTVGFIDFSAEL